MNPTAAPPPQTKLNARATGVVMRWFYDLPEVHRPRRCDLPDLIARVEDAMARTDKEQAKDAARPQLPLVSIGPGPIGCPYNNEIKEGY